MGTLYDEIRDFASQVECAKSCNAWLPQEQERLKSIIKEQPITELEEQVRAYTTALRRMHSDMLHGIGIYRIADYLQQEQIAGLEQTCGSLGFENKYKTPNVRMERKMLDRCLTAGTKDAYCMDVTPGGLRSCAIGATVLTAIFAPFGYAITQAPMSQLKAGILTAFLMSEGIIGGGMIGARRAKNPALKVAQALEERMHELNALVEKYLR
jgi:hypothetical protein